MAIYAESFVPAGAVLPAGVYHSDVYMPEEIRALVPATLSLRYTRHAEEAAADETAYTTRYGALVLPKRLELAQTRLVEVDAFRDRLCQLHAGKMLVRQTYDARRGGVDLVLAIQICHGLYHGLDIIGLVRTVWLNKCSDNHRTLRRCAYVQPFF
ncbi:MAG: hypothetical protein M0Z85_01695 [Gammaproteobacteria bacterium]|nr:hypothetical protein [Gammaproteobacteria bacterium]